MKGRPLLFGLGAMLMGSALVFVTIVMINRLASGPQAEAVTRTAQLDFEKKEKPKHESRVRKPEPPKRKPQRTPPAPLVGIDASLSGLDLGLPGFDAGDLGDLSGDLLGSTEDVVMTDDSVDERPRPVQQSPMPYPVRAKARGIEGYVLLSVLISPTGEVERVKVLESNPSGIFEEVAVTGVRNWKFDPAQYRGENVRVWARQRVRFELS